MNQSPSLDCRDFQVLAFLSAVAFLSFSLSETAAESQQLRAQRHVISRPIGDFQLVDQNGSSFQFKNLAGRVVVIAFAYTTCVDVCPLITAAMRQVQIGLRQEERKDVQLLTITTDPEIDSPKVLSSYASRYGAEFGNWAFLTGNPSALKNVWKNFGVVVKRRGRGLIDHTPLTAIIDQRSVMRVGYVGPSPDSKAVLADVRSLLHKSRSLPAKPE